MPADPHPPSGGSGSAPAARAALSAAVAEVWARCREAVLARVDVVEGAARALKEGRLDGEGRREAEREAHRLAGTAGTFGFPEASRLAREAESLLGGAAAPQPADAPRLAELAEGIRRELTGPAPPAASGPTAE